jgi:hypothetical protein
MREIADFGADVDWDGHGGNVDRKRVRVAKGKRTEWTGSPLKGQGGRKRSWDE